MPSLNVLHRADPSLRDLAAQIYARVSSGHDKLAYCVDGAGPAVVVRGADGRLAPATWQGGVLGPWQRAKEQRPDGSLVDRTWNPWVMLKHLQGKYSVAPTSPGWVEWVALDIDAHPQPGVPEFPARRAAQEQADRVLANVWRALGCSAERHPLVLRSPGGGYHVWFPLTRDDGPAPHAKGHAWPAAVARAWFERHLEAAGLTLAPGVLEVFPSGRCLRAPCGRGMRLLRATFPNDPDNLGMVNWPGTVAYQRGAAGMRAVRQIEAMASVFVAQWDTQRRSLADWLGRPAAQWDEKWGFLGWREGDAVPEIEKKQGSEIRGESVPSQQSDDVLGSPGGFGVPLVAPAVVAAAVLEAKVSRKRKANVATAPDAATPPEPAAGPLVRGLDFKVKVQTLLTEGITLPNTRHDAVLTLCFFWGATCGLETEEVLARLGAWCGALAHAGSRLAPRDFATECLREASSYLASYGPRWRFRGSGASGGLATLSTADAVVLNAVAPAVRDEVATILSWLAARADARGHIGDPVQIATGLLHRLCGDRRVVLEGQRRRATTIAVEELERLGVLTLAKNYVVGRQGRLFACWYQLGSGVLPRVETVPRAAWVQLRASGEALTPVEAEAPAAPAIVRVVGERTVPEGVLQVLSDGVRGVPRTRLVLAAESGPALPTAGGRAAWYVRMFESRSFTPGELRVADASKVVPFPDLLRRRRRTTGQGPPPDAVVGDAAAIAARAWGLTRFVRPVPA